MKQGLVLEGGAMRGMYTAGVMDVLMENGVSFDGIVGVSAGAVFGCNYKSHQIGRVIRYGKRFCNDPRFVGLKSLVTTGNLYNAEFAYHDVPFIHDIFDVETFAADPTEFYVVCTDVETGKPVYERLDTGDQKDIDWMRASASMPVVSRPVEIDGLKLLDGGVSDPIPVKWFQSIGYEKNIVVLTRQKGYRKKPSGGALMKAALHRYPELAKAMQRRSELYNETIDSLETMFKEGSILILRPSVPPNVHRVENDPKKLEKLYQLGRRDTKRRMKYIRRFLEC